MTSSFSEKLTKVKNALEHVFVKKTDIKNNLTSTDTDKPLSANQGKVLNDGKVDKVSGKGLSTNDFTASYKNKLDNLNINDIQDTTLENGVSLWLYDDEFTYLFDDKLMYDGDSIVYNSIGEIGTIVDIENATQDMETTTNKITSWFNSEYDNGWTTGYPNARLVKTSLDNKVDKITGKQLSTNDFTDALKSKLENNVVTYPDLARVAETGSYNDLSNTPAIPTSSSDLNDGSDLVKKSQTNGLIKNDGTIDTTSYSTFNGSYNNLTNKPNIPKIFYGTCDTEAATNPKVVVTSSDFVLETGIILMVKFDKTQTYNASTNAPLQLKINNNSPVNVALYGSNYNMIYQWVNGEIVHFVYDGQDFRISNRSVASTANYGVTKLTNNLSSTTESLALTAAAGKILNDNKLDKAQTEQKGKNVVVDLNGNIAFENKPTIPSKTSDLTNDSGFLTSHQSLDGKNVTIEKQATAESGYTATYVLKQGGTALSPKINIPKDYLVKSGTLETVGTTPTTLESTNNLTTGDKYLKFIVNTQENDDSTTLIIPVNDLIDTYAGDNTTITLNNGVFSVKSNVFANKSHAHGNIDNDGTWKDGNIISTLHTNYPIFVDTSDNGKIKRGYISTKRIKEPDAYSNIGSAAGDTQSTINGQINTKLGNLNDLIGNAITYINQ